MVEAMCSPYLCLILWNEEKMLEKMHSNSSCNINEPRGKKTTFVEMSASLSHRYCFSGSVLSVAIVVELLMMVDHNIFLSEVDIGQLGHMPHNQNLLYCLLQQLLEVTHHL